MSDNSASFKVTLHRECSDEIEVRRFVLPKSASSSYSILQDKLHVVFHSIKNQPFEVTWQDDEGDRIMISSDEELMIAMREMRDDVYRLRVTTGKQRNVDLNGGLTGGQIHDRVSCDVCSGNVLGFRYKCIQCPNYDLCSSCEMNKHHKEHFMVRIPEPALWKTGFGQRLSRVMARSARKHRGGGCASGEASGRGNGSHHNHSCHYHEYGSSGRRYPIPQFVEELFRNMWYPNATPPEEQGEAAAATSPDKKADPKDDGHVTYLKTIGETVASLLDPLGTGNKSTEQNLGNSPQKASSGDKAPGPVSASHYPNLNFDHEGERIPNVMDQPGSNNVPILYPMAPYPGHNVPVHYPPILPPIVTHAPQHNLPPGQMTGPVHPHHAPPPVFQQMSHPRPHINHSLALMTAMGFKNEGGWLTSLLEAVNGDVSKALDILQPVKK
ncbi:sequestosome-1-like isoform X2 [Hetaerina americana]|uniref:sequestosome-1-like isoform X2 n=1 Tax=Hetaerina americana TaxID=62018 RepID=UPI003A7F1BD4